MENSILLNERTSEVRWSKGSCGNSGCTDPECVCALCAKPIGVPEDDPRWVDHDDDCPECELCVDEVPVILFRGEGEEMMQAAFHIACFNKLIAARREG